MSTQMWIRTLLFHFIITQGQEQLDSSSGHIYYHRDIHHPYGTYYQERLNFPKSNQISANYTITFSAEKCCPVFGFQRLTNGWETVQDGFYIGCSDVSLSEVALYSPFYIYTQEGFPGTDCARKGNNYTCMGNRFLTASEQVEWAFAAGYECDSRQNLEVRVEFHLEYMQNYIFPCEPFQIQYCKDLLGFNYTTFPNAIGQVSQRDANKLLVLLKSLDEFTDCYQHMYLFICYGLFPRCINGRRHMPCVKMCQEAAAGCKDFLSSISQPLYCGLLIDSLDPSVCFYKEIKCPEPEQLHFGSVIVKGYGLYNISRYICNEGYELIGDSVRHCQSSGKWNSTVPVCKLKLSNVSQPRTPTAVIITATLIPILLIVGIVILCVLLREQIALFLFYKNGCLKNDPENVKRLFVSYSSKDAQEVSDEFLPLLKNELQQWKVETYQEDFLAGRSIIDCIKEGVWESGAVLVLLTENFVASEWCKFEFIQAETRSITDKYFKLIVIMFREDKANLQTNLIEDFPDRLKQYIETRIYLSKGEYLFWNKLRRALIK